MDAAVAAAAAVSFRYIGASVRPDSILFLANSLSLGGGNNKNASGSSLHNKGLRTILVIGGGEG